MKTIITSIAVFISLTVSAQHNKMNHGAADSKSNIKSMSEADIEGYKNGNGMGQAKAAELNSYPGPMHVLDFKKELGLTAAQIEKITIIYNAMKKDATVFGSQLIDAESALNKAFQDKKISSGELEKLTSQIGNLIGKLRFTHLNAHIKTTNELNAFQIGKYNELRGYANDKVQYTCPMHPEVISDKPGSCPKCKMDLIKK